MDIKPRMVAGLTAAILLTLPALVFGHDDGEQPKGMGLGRPAERGTPQAIEEKLELKREEKQNQPERQAVGQPRSCQAHERNIQRRSAHLARLADNMLQVFARIAERVAAFYTTVLVPGGQTLANYDALLSDIAAKKALVEAAITTAQDAAASFTCEVEDPKAVLRQFRQDMRGVKRALHDYRKSVRNLIVAVRSLAGKTPSATPTPTASPSPSPT